MKHYIREYGSLFRSLEKVCKAGSPEHEADPLHRVRVDVHKEEAKDVPVKVKPLDANYWVTGTPENFLNR